MTTHAVRGKFEEEPLMGNKSKALEKSNSTRLVYGLCSKFLARSCRVRINCDLQENPLRKPCWRSESSECSSK